MPTGPTPVSDSVRIISCGRSMRESDERVRLSQSVRARSRQAGSARTASFPSAGPFTHSFHAGTRWNTMERSKLKKGASGLNATTGQRSAPSAWMR